MIEKKNISPDPTEDEIKEKKKKRAENYYIAAAYNKKKNEEEMHYFKKITGIFFGAVSPIVKKEFPLICRKALELYTFGEYCRERTNTFFALPEDDPETEKTREALSEVGLKEENFVFAAFAACKEKIKEIAHFLSGMDPQPDKEEISKYDKIRDNAVLEAREALYEYKNGNPVIFAKMIAAGLVVSCSHFEGEEDKDVAMQWSMYTEEMLGILESNKELVELSGLTEKQLELARKAAKMGQDIRKGLKAIELINEKIKSEDTNLDPQQFKDFKKSIDSMGFVIIEKEDAGFVKEWYKDEINKEEKHAPVKEDSLLKKDIPQLKKEVPQLKR